MAGKKTDISVGIGVLGETQFQAALRQCENSLKQLDAGLKANAAEFGNNESAMRSSYERNQLLKRSLEENVKINEALGAAIEHANKEYGEASAEATKYATAQARARANIAKLSRELEESDKAIEEVGQESVRTGRKIESGIGDSAEEAAKDVKSLYEALKEDIGSIGSSSAVSAFTDIGGAVTGAFSALNDFAEGGRDYRRQMAFLEQNARSAGMEFSDVEAQLLTVTGLTGDLDGAVEGVSNLLASGFDTHGMEDAINSLAGTVIRFPETMKFENLAESLQESISTGEGTGQFAELIERIAGSEGLEKFNAQMAAATSEADKQKIALETLNSLGLTKAYEEYKNLNGELINAETASQKLSGAWASLGSTVDTMLSPIKEGLANAIGAIDDFIKNDTLNTWFTNIGNFLGGGDDKKGIFSGWFSKSEEEGKEAGVDIIDGMNEAMNTNAETAKKNADTIGSNVMTSMGDGAAAQIPYVVSQYAAAHQAIEATMSKPIQGPKIVMPASSYGAASGAVGTTAAGVGAATINLDGKTVGEGMVEYNSDATGKKIDRATTYLY